MSATPRVLIVDDNPTSAELVERLVRGEGMDPVKCLGGREALALLDAEHFDAVILDLMMPEVDGYEVLRKLQAKSRTAQLPVIVLSAKSTRLDVDKALEMGARHYLTKPFNRLELVQKLRSCIEGP
jgi:DNA-binding response OmpR family regulator